ncbi:MAG: VIT family protein [Neisseria sp.]|nr:VIT family protein [Neisseria sp.]
MNTFHSNTHRHFSHRSNWLRAGVLGANDGLISTSALLMGMVAARPDTHTLLLTACAALVAGAVSMAAGEYVSVSSQSDTEQMDLRVEQHALTHFPDDELAELTQIYQERGLSPELAAEVAKQLSAHDALAAHARDEIGLSDTLEANPLQAALASAAAFCCGAVLPLLVVWLGSAAYLMEALAISTVLGLAILGAVSAKLGGAPMLRAVCRVVFWGVMAMAMTAAIGHLMGVNV